jgi:hypothetical protein
MSKYVIEIDDTDLEDGCAYCPLNYDYQGCQAFHGPRKNDPMIGLEIDGSPKERPKNCPLVPYEKKTTTRDGKGKTKYGRWVPLCECCGYAIGDRRYYFCPKCGAEIVGE